MKNRKLKRMLSLFLATGSVAGLYAGAGSVQAEAATKPTYKVVTQGVNSNNKYVWDNQTDSTKTGNIVKKNGSSWAYIENGAVATSYRGENYVQNDRSKWLVTNGWVNFGMTDMQWVNNNLIYFEKGRHINDKRTVRKYNGDGKWYYIDNASAGWGYTGMSLNENGCWWVENTTVNFNKTNWQKVSSSQSVFGDSSDTWYYFEGGKLMQGSYNGQNVDCRKNTDNGGWYVVGDCGKADWGYNGLVQNSNGWYYVRNGRVDWSYSGACTNKHGTWYVKKGAVDQSFNGSAYGYIFINGKKK